MLLLHCGRQRGVAGGARGLRVFHEAEVEKLGLPALRHENVGRLDVPVDDAARVGRLEGVGDLGSEVEKGVQGQRSGAEAIAQGLAVEQLHRDEGPALMLVHVVDRADVRMLEGGGSAGFALQALESLSVLGELIRQELQGDAAAELEVLGLVDDAHAPASELREDAIVGDRLADHGCSRRARNSFCLRIASVRIAANSGSFRIASKEGFRSIEG